MSRDKISLRGMSFYGFHGVSPEERALGQRFIVDVDLEKDLSLPGKTDNLHDTVDYSQVYSVVGQVMAGPGRNLLEALAEAIAGAILDRFQVEAVRVRVEKPQVRLAGTPTSAAVVVYRRRSGL